MYQQSFVSRRHRYLLTWAPVVALGIVLGLGGMVVSCTGLEPFPAGYTGSGSGSTSSTSSGSTSSTSSGSSASGGSSASSSNSSMCATEAMSIIGGSTTNAIAFMHGQPSNCPGTPNLTNIFTTPGIPNEAKGIFYRDGPRGVCLAANLPIGKQGYSTVFPSGSARGATFDVALEKQIGADMGDEVVASHHTEILAPVINILRHPAWGRAQETYGEDSYELGRLGSAYVEGAQEYIPACAKHFAANNVEKGRQSNTSQMDEQTLHEIYGRHFEMVVQDANVACIMASYNLVQSTDAPDPAAYHSTENHELLTTMLRQTFGFQGFVISDWWALPGDNAACSAMPAQQALTSTLAINAGLDLEMPWYDNFTQLQNDLMGGTITAPQVVAAGTYVAQKQCEFNILNPNTGSGLMPSTSTQDPTTDNIENASTHIQDARLAETEAMVLLKNGPSGADGGAGAPTLPIPSTVKTIAVIGATVPFSLESTDIDTGTVNFITSEMSGGGFSTHLSGDLGSSRVYSDPATFVGPLLGITNGAPTGTTVVSGSSPTALVDSTGAAYTGSVDFYVVVAGDTPEDEGEDYTGGSDRSSFQLDDKLILEENMSAVQDPLIESVAALGTPMVVVLEGGSVINMPWLSMVPAVVMAWYPGQEFGDALADLLFGKKNFSGKLPTTWPNPNVGTCPGTCPLSGTCPACFGDEPLFSVGEGRVTPMPYWHGYRYYDHMNIKPLFAFGYGMSYTTYSYGTPTLSAPTLAVSNPSNTVTVTVPVTNMGTMSGDEVSFAFVAYPNTKRTGHTNVKELKGFTRTTISAGATTMVNITLRAADLKYWDTPTSKWVYETGAINVMVGGRSDSLLAPVTLTLQ